MVYTRPCGSNHLGGAAGGAFELELSTPPATAEHASGWRAHVADGLESRRSSAPPPGCVPRELRFSSRVLSFLRIIGTLRARVFSPAERVAGTRVRRSSEPSPQRAGWPCPDRFDQVLFPRASRPVGRGDRGTPAPATMSSGRSDTVRCGSKIEPDSDGRKLIGVANVLSMMDTRPIGAPRIPPPLGIGVNLRGAECRGSVKWLP